LKLILNNAIVIWHKYDATIIHIIIFIFQTVDHGKYYYATHVVLMQLIEYAVLLNVSKLGTVQHVKPMQQQLLYDQKFHMLAIITV